jgi:hypothetical protein
MVAMALSIALLSLIPYWQHRPAEEALAGYVTSRILLNMNLDQLDQNPAWQYYKESHQDAEVAGISRLPAVFTYPPAQWQPRSEGSGTPSASQDWRPDASPAGARDKESRMIAIRVPVKLTRFRAPREAIAQVPPTSFPSAPAPPTGLTASLVGPIPEITEIAVLVGKLNDSRQLERASSYSNYYLFSIARWVQKKRMLAWHDQLQSRCPLKAIDLPARGSSPSEPDPQLLFDCLSIRDWRELAAYEMPSTGSPDQNQIGGGIQKEVDVAIGNLPHRGDLASFVAAAALVLTLFYFGAFLREATRSAHFPAAGTLFGAFSRAPSASLLMLFALVFPLLSSLAVAIVSKSWILYPELLFVGLAIYWVFLGFQKESYFSSALALFRPGPGDGRKGKPTPKNPRSNRRS